MGRTGWWLCRGGPSQVRTHHHYHQPYHHHYHQPYHHHYHHLRLQAEAAHQPQHAQAEAPLHSSHGQQCGIMNYVN